MTDCERDKIVIGNCDLFVLSFLFVFPEGNNGMFVR